jgi:TPR repeat protein
MLLGVCLLFSVPAALSIRSPHLHWPSVGICACSLSVLMLIFFIPVWVAAARAQTPADHRLVAEAYALRGQFLSNDSEAFEHYLISAQGGDVEAQRRVGEAYLFCHFGVAYDMSKARQWLTAAAGNGDSGAAQLLKSIEGTP